MWIIEIFQEIIVQEQKEVKEEEIFKCVCVKAE